jgi:Domain of unknown function (DUF4136)
MKRAFASFLLLVLLCGCQQTISTTVTRFNDLPPTLPANQTFAILPQGPQVGNLEFQHTAGFVAAALQRYGFRPVPENAPADLVVLLQYGPAGARTEVIDYGPGWYGPGWYPWWGFPPYQAYTLYSQFLEVDIAAGPAWRRGERRMDFQGRAFAETGAREFNIVAPYLIEALFQNFPGLNGETVRVKVPVNDP